MIYFMKKRRELPSIYSKTIIFNLMDRRKFIKQSGQVLLAASTISITGVLVTSCSSNDDSDDFFDDGYYDDGYYDGY